MRMEQGFACKVCRAGGGAGAGGRKAVDEFRFKDVKLECVSEFAYLGNIPNDTGGWEQVVAARMRAVWMKCRELGGILCMREASVRRCCV